MALVLRKEAGVEHNCWYLPLIQLPAKAEAQHQQEQQASGGHTQMKLQLTTIFPLLLLINY